MSAQEFKQWINDRMDGEALPETTQLHHYATAATLEKILQSKEFHFTDAFHQNDPVQVAYGIDYAHAVLKEEDEKEWADSLSNAKDLFHYFVGCFCKDGNKLDLWRFYGDDGRGFRITLHPNSFEHEGIGLFAKNCEYQVNATIGLHREVAQNAREAVKNLPRFDNEEIDQIRDLLISRFLWNSIFAKPKDYKSEEEVRLVVVDDKTKIQKENIIKCRVQGGALIPYVPLKLKSNGAILEIMAGPAAAETVVENVKHLLRQHGWGTEIPVSRSLIPYRPPERL